MKRTLALLAFLPFNALAGTSATVTAASNYIWRGVSFSNDQPAIQGSIDYASEIGISAGVWASNSITYRDSAQGGTSVMDSEADVYGTYTHTIGDVGISATAFWYNYVKEPRNNALEYILGVAFKQFKFELAYLPKYFAGDSTSTYAKVSVRQPVDEKLSVVAHVGNQDFSNETNAGYKKYIDYKLGAVYSAEGW